MESGARFFLSLQRVKRLYAGVFRTLRGDTGLTQNEVDILLFLANNAPLDTARDIVQLRGLSKSQVCQSVDALRRLGLLETRQDARDRRWIHLRLLPAAQPVVIRARAAQGLFFERLYQGVSGEERQALERVLQKIERNVEEADDGGHADEDSGVSDRGAGRGRGDGAGGPVGGGGDLPDAHHVSRLSGL